MGGASGATNRDPPGGLWSVLWVHARRVKQQSGELCENVGLSEPESHFRVNVFTASLDIVISQLLQRLFALRETSDLFQAIQP